MSIQICGAPCCWGVDDPKNPYLPPWTRVLEEAGKAGYSAIELGPYGYLPIEVQTMISDETGIPLEKIYGVSTFYSQFALQPKGKYQISVCLGTACYVKGSGAIFSKLEELLGITNGECTPDGRFSLDSCRCVGACGLAPAMSIDDQVYKQVNPDKLEQILERYYEEEGQE